MRHAWGSSVSHTRARRVPPHHPPSTLGRLLCARWTDFVGALSGLLCTSLVLLDGGNHVAPTTGFARTGHSRGGGVVFKYGVLPREQVCAVAVLWLCCGCAVAVLWLCCGCAVTVL